MCVQRVLHLLDSAILNPATSPWANDKVVNLWFNLPEREPEALMDQVEERAKQTCHPDKMLRGSYVATVVIDVNNASRALYENFHASDSAKALSPNPQWILPGQNSYERRTGRSGKVVDVRGFGTGNGGNFQEGRSVEIHAGVERKGVT